MAVETFGHSTTADPTAAASGLTLELLLVSITVGIVGYVLLLRRFPARPALAVTVLKVALPTAYFAWFYDGTWNILDDITYAEIGHRLLQQEYTPISLLSPEGIAVLKSATESRHIFYWWWNTFAMTLFGHKYYAPVFLNVLLTFVAALYFVAVLRELGFPERYRRWCGLFLLVHWDLLVWSSFLNVKDILVLVLTIVAIYGFIRVCRSLEASNEVSWPGLAHIAGSFAVFWWVRFYVPVLLIGAACTWMFLHWRHRLKYPVAAMLVLPTAVLVQRGLWALDKLEPTLFAYGMVRFILTPRPWGVNQSYTFLVLPSLFHWMTVVLAAVAALNLFRTSKRARFVLAYLAIVVAFYAMVPQLQGPRHRFQVSFVWAWLQFHFAWMVKERVRIVY